MEIGSSSLGTLKEFEPLIPKHGYVTVGELNGHFHEASAEEMNEGGWVELPLFSSYLENHINISPSASNNKPNIFTQATQKISKDYSQESLFIDNSPQLTFISTISSYLFDFDLHKDTVGKNKDEVDSPSKVPKPKSKITSALVSACKYLFHSKEAIENFICPKLKLTNEEIVQEFSPVRDWSKGWIKGMAWHERHPLLAIIFKDDSVRYYCNSLKQEASPMLRAPEQSLASCIAWHPYIKQFAVGVETGFVIWTVFNKETNYKDKSEFITSLGHTPVTSIQFSENGDYILTSSPRDTSILIWNVGTWDKVALQRIKGGGIPRAKWLTNKSGNKIFSSTISSCFRLWLSVESTPKAQSWDTSGPIIDAFAFHPSGNFIIFASGQLLYSICFSQIGGSATILALSVITETQLDSEKSDQSFRIGGRVRCLEWDPLGERLAVLFDKCSQVAIFKIYPSCELRLIPVGLISGKADEEPLSIAFQKDFMHGSLLTIAWSSERVQYFPMILGNKQIGDDISIKNKIRPLFSNTNIF